MIERLDVVTPGGSYPVWIGPGALAEASSLIPAAERTCEAVALVSDATVAGLHRERARAGLAGLGARIEEFSIEPGERSKDASTAGSLWRWLAERGFHRGDHVIAMGGGVVGDLAGFVAATYHRGVPLVQIPTTLLAQVDSSIGGKTAIDLPEGKNLVGAFHQPRAVIADIDVLATLPDAEFATGMAEVIKHALITPGDLALRLLAERDAIVDRETATLTRMVVDAARVKVEVVQEDEREAGVRAYLNYGHTLAHALEHLGAYGERTHGEAVAVGCMFAAHLARALGGPDLVGAHRRLLDAFGLPTGGAGYAFDDVARAWSRDKKYDAGMRFVLLEARGTPRLRGDIPEAALREAYEAVR